MTPPTIQLQQYRWRRWPEVYPALGDLRNKQVIDFGCGIGDQTRDLSRLGAEVVGVDANAEAIDHARSRGIPGARFVCGDIAGLGDLGMKADGVWTSFTAAYFTRFEVLVRAAENVTEPGGWLAITEIDDLFGHGPLDSRWREVFEDYYGQSLDEGRHRFRSHAHVREVLARRGWRIAARRDLEDDEFCFEGPAPPEVLDGWRNRLERMMPRFLERFGDRAKGLDTAFLRCLASREHVSSSRVWFLLALAPCNPVEAGDGVEQRRYNP
jgi:SAM-dependent methyltransferase